MSEDKLKELIEGFFEQSENFIITKAMEIFLNSEDNKVKLQALELLAKARQL